MIARLQLITQEIPDFSHAAQVAMACKSGAEWIQLRVKDKTYEEWLDIAGEVAVICRKNAVPLIINDSVQIAMEIDADGVHLGKDDMPIHSARMLLGKDKIIGGTGNTLEDIIAIHNAGADYAGIGPYKFTKTKKELSNLLGTHGYRNMLYELRTKGIDIPVIAIGGIKAMDVRPLIRTGVFGVAVSSAVFSAPIPAQALHELRRAVYECFENREYATSDHS